MSPVRWLGSTYRGGFVPFPVEIYVSTSMMVAPVVSGHGGQQRVLRQMLQSIHAKVGDHDEVLGLAEAPVGGLRLQKQIVHRLAAGVAAPVKRAAYDAREVFLWHAWLPL